MEAKEDDRVSQPLASGALASPGRLRRRAVQSLIACGVLLVVAVVAGELVARFVLGLGTPPLTVHDPSVEYMFRPNQHVYRFGNLQRYNAYGMRSDDFPAEREVDGEVRVLVFGDSVINGGNLTDQPNVGTELLRDRLREDREAPVVVGNISAGSWGPPNLLAYIERYGWFDADAAIIVVSNHDAWDLPAKTPPGPLTHPTRRPWSALVEGITRYVPRYLPSWGGESSAESVDGMNPWHTPERAAKGLAALDEIFASANEAGVSIGLIVHRRRSMLDEPPTDNEVAFELLAAQAGVPVIPLEPLLKARLAGGNQPYRDDIHPNDKGQRVLADAYGQMIEQLLVESDAATD